MTFTEFMRARFAEDLDTAEHVVAVLEGLPHKPGAVSVDGRDVYDLRRVSREIKAKLRILEIHQLDPIREHSWGRRGGGCNLCDHNCNTGGDSTSDGPCDTLRALAAVYVDHPDYLEEWRPDTPRVERGG